MEKDINNLFNHDLFCETTKEEFDQFEEVLKPRNTANRNAIDVDLTEAAKVAADNLDKFFE